MYLEVVWQTYTEKNYARNLSDKNNNFYISCAKILSSTNYLKKNYVCIIKVVLKKYSSTVVRENLYIKFICYVKVMLRIHPSKVYKMLYVKVVFTSSHFHRRKVCEEKKLS